MFMAARILQECTSYDEAGHASVLGCRLNQHAQRGWSHQQTDLLQQECLCFWTYSALWKGGTSLLQMSILAGVPSCLPKLLCGHGPKPTLLWLGLRLRTQLLGQAGSQRQPDMQA